MQMNLVEHVEQVAAFAANIIGTMSVEQTGLCTYDFAKALLRDQHRAGDIILSARELFQASELVRDAMPIAWTAYQQSVTPE
jgi:hypothetical protein